MPTNKKDFCAKINDFRYSDSIPATASKFLLAALAAGPLIVVGIALPGLLKETARFQKSNRFTKKQLENSYRNLKYRKLIEIVREKDGKTEVRLSNKGKQRVKEFSLQSLRIATPKKWDGKWRILIFDIPSKPAIYNQARNALRAKIKELRFVQIQKSVWAHPYECEDEILFIAELYNIQ